MKACGAVLATALALGACASAAPGLYDSAPLDDPVLGPCAWTGRITGRFVYQESALIRGYFEPATLGAYRVAVRAPFTMPERPLIRVSVLDFYEMVNGPAYRESEVSVLALHEGQPGWLVLTMPVTDGDSCGGGRAAWGYPKVVRRVTLDRSADRYVGTSYTQGGHAPEFALTLDAGEPDAAARDLLRFVHAFPNLTLRQGSVMKFGGLRQPVEELARAAPGAWAVRLGEARLAYPPERDNLLHRLGVGRPLAGYWSRLRASYSITPR